MKRQIRISVANISNEHVHFERCIDTDSNIVIPYDDIVNTLLFLFRPLNVKVVIETADL